MTESIQAWFVTAQRHLLWKNCGTVCCCLSCSFSSFLLLSAFVFTLLFNIKTASALPNGREKEEEVQNHICQKNRHWYQRRTNVSSSAWGKEKEGMEELQYIENGMRAHTDNAITKVWCDLRVKAEDWEFGLLGDIWVSSINLSLTLGNFLCSSICLPIYIFLKLLFHVGVVEIDCLFVKFFETLRWEKNRSYWRLLAIFLYFCATEKWQRTGKK